MMGELFIRSPEWWDQRRARGRQILGGHSMKTSVFLLLYQLEHRILEGRKRNEIHTVCILRLRDVVRRLDGLGANR
jgi:hypothetical protein